MLRTDEKTRNVGKLYGWASLNAIEKIKHGLNNNEQLTFQMRKTEQGKQGWSLNVFMNHNSTDCVNMIQRILKEGGIVAKKDMEKKRKILESEVTASAMA